MYVLGSFNPGVLGAGQLAEQPAVSAAAAAAAAAAATSATKSAR